MAGVAVGLDWPAVALLLEVEAPGPGLAGWRRAALEFCRVAEPAALAAMLKSQGTGGSGGDAG